MAAYGRVTLNRGGRNSRFDCIKNKLEIEFYFFSTFRKITVGGFVNQLIKKFWPEYA